MRHGRSRADDEGVHEGRYDSPLTEIGRSQVERLGILWKDQGIRFDNQ
ncbi:MAG TPA: phosphoglycerate mutase family protein [Anaerolineales bacterium]|nr:phosphoglycerate mutase family protein [Anaerolineales bacterium]